MKLEELLLNEYLEAFLREILDKKMRVSFVQVLKRLPDYLVLQASLQGIEQRLVIKVAGDQSRLPGQFERTAAMLQLVREQTNIQMPQVLAADASRKHFPWGYLVRTDIPGFTLAQVRSLLSETDRLDFFDQLGRAVGELHAIHFPAFGELDDGLQLPYPLELLPALEERARSIILKESQLDLFLNTLEKHQEWFCDPVTASLVHEDLHAYNLIIQRTPAGWKLATILDFDKAWAGPAESDLARLDFWRGMIHPQFWSAYTKINPIQDGYAERRLIYQLLWCLEYGEPGEEHYQDTRAVCQKLGISDLPRF